MPPACTTPTRPPGTPFAFEEGPYYRTKEPRGAFRMTIQYRALDRRPVTPGPPAYPNSRAYSPASVRTSSTYQVAWL